MPSLLCLLLLFFLPSPLSSTQSCTTPLPFFNFRLFSTCVPLPHLSATLRFTYNTSNSTLSLAFAAPSPGWAAWGIGQGMVGVQSLIAFRRSDGTVGANTFNISQYGPVRPSRIMFETWGLEAKSEQYGGLVGVFVTVKLPPGVRRVSQVWQVGPIGPGGGIGRHAFQDDNLKAVGVIDVVSGQSTMGLKEHTGLSSREIHGILNVVSWGILLPIGAMVARWLKEFIPGSPAWFYLHVSGQLIGYSIGVAGWGIGLKLGSESPGITYTMHRNIAISLFCLATLQVFALFMRPKKEHKYRIYWNAYHHSVGYTVILLGVYNVFRGFNILNPDRRWRDAYIVVLCCLAVVAMLLEIRSWCSISKDSASRKHSDASIDTI